MSTSWSQARERGPLWGMYVVFWMTRLLGYWGGVALLYPIAGVMWLTNSRGRHSSRQYLEMLSKYAQSGQSFNSYRHFLSFAINIYDRLWFWQHRFESFNIERQGHENMVSLAQTGGLLIGAHIGSFDLMRTFSSHVDFKLTVVLYGVNSTKINSIFKKLSGGNDVKIISLKPGDYQSIFKLQESIEAGEIVAIMGDRFSASGDRGRASSVQFLGQDILMPQNVWLMAHLLKCPVMFAYGVRRGWRDYLMCCEPITDSVILPRAERVESMNKYIQSYTAKMEDLCLKYPYQWFNYFDFWRTDNG